VTTVAAAAAAAAEDGDSKQLQKEAIERGALPASLSPFRGRARGPETADW
jgi:hypothetical protein